MRVTRMFTVLSALVIMSTLLLSACGSSSAAGSNNLTVGSKKDADSRLEAAMYVLLLHNAGYNVTLKPGFDNTTVGPAIDSGQIDLYPEFTGTGLNMLGLKGSSDPQTAYNEVKSGYESKYHITWLDAAYGLNDDYGLCTSQANATKFNLHNISDVTAVASQLTLAAPSDAISAPDVVPAMESTYSLTFKKTVQIDVDLAFAAVTQGQADVNVCYTTDSNIVTQNFVLLNDDKNAFPVYNPAPIVRDAVLSAHPNIKTILNPLATKLTTAAINPLIKQVTVDGTPADVVAKAWLQSQGLLPK
jgi:osmoprotectant transport system substrate-binding protein